MSIQQQSTQTPCVSVVVPIYNVEEYLAECLDSLVAQTIDSLEVILVDDGSTDGSAVIAQEYVNQHNNFVYYKKENGGLGDARNFGMDRAHGEYICFCDSDDTVPPQAYAHMYALAKKYDADIVSGDMVRFNSKRTYASSMHRIAFANACEDMNIFTHPELLYDATTPSKLIRLQFLQASDLRFPVGVYYEDIPFNLPIQCLTKRYAHLDEVVYNWRAREGTAQSLSQKRTEWKNCADRFKVMEMLDGFFIKHVNDEQLFLEKQVRNLVIDLAIFIRVLPKADAEYQQKFMELAVPYVKNISPEALARVNAVDRMKYWFIANNDLEGLLGYLPYAKAAAKALPVSYKNGRVYGKFKQKTSSFYTDMTYETEKSGCAINATSVKLDAQNGLAVEGDIFFRSLGAKQSDNISLRAFLESCTNNSVISELPAIVELAKQPKTKVNHAYRYAMVRFVPCRKTRYVLHIAWQELQQLACGQYRIRLEYTCNGLTCSSVQVAYPVKDDGAHPYPLYANQKCYLLLFNASAQLRIKIEECKEAIIDSIHSDNNRCFLRENGQTIWTQDSPVQTLSEAKSLAENIESFSFRSNIGSPQYIKVGKALIRFSTAANSYLKAKALPVGALSYKASFINNRFEFEIQELEQGQLDSCLAAVFKGRKTGQEIYCPVFTSEENGIVGCRIDVADNDIAEQLPSDTYNLYLQCTNFDNARTYLVPVYSIPRRNVETQVLRHQRHKYSLTLNGREGFGVSLAWNYFQGSRRRRKIIRKFAFLPLYKICRKLLPLGKKTILFESYWGTQAGCNPAGLYRYISQNHPEYTCIWSLEDERMPVEGNAKRIRKGSLQYYLSMARSHYLINNVNFENWYKKRKSQIEIQTTHGVPLKKVGFAAPNEFATTEALEAFAQRCSRWDYLIASGPKTREILAENYRFDKKFLNTGFPRNDILLHRHTPEVIADLKRQHGIAPSQKIVLYAPTWRAYNKCDIRLDFTKLQNMLGAEWSIGFRPHHFSAPAVAWDDMDPRLLNFSAGWTSEECYLVADVLVTDYSSLMFDYLVLKKPIIFFAYDLENYRDNLRGFNFDFEKEAPGPILKTSDEVIDALCNIDKVVAKYADKYRLFADAYCGYEQGNAAEQIFEQVMLQREARKESETLCQK